MAHEKLAERLGAYYARLGAGKAHKIKVRDVEKVLEKLHARRAELAEEAPEKPEKAARLASRIETADELISRAEWLLAEITRIAGPAPLLAEEIPTPDAPAPDEGAAAPSEDTKQD
ncbi:MAG: hypothetical protein LAT78_08390 [Roseinatronobacter sp.]|nr:hypothetical protein [Roseinatronobacter sp.]